MFDAHIMSIKDLLSPKEANVISDVLDGDGLLDDAYSLNLVAIIFMIAFQFFTPCFVDSTYNFTNQMHLFHMFSISNTSKTNI